VDNLTELNLDLEEIFHIFEGIHAPSVAKFQLLVLLVSSLVVRSYGVVYDPIKKVLERGGVCWN
jgi:hypothetical protein